MVERRVRCCRTLLDRAMGVGGLRRASVWLLGRGRLGQRGPRRWVLGGGAALSLLGVGFAWCWARFPDPTQLSGLPPAMLTVSKPDRVSVLFGGDTHFGESYFPDPEKPSAVASYGYDYPLRGVAPLAASADFVVLNLETPLTRETDSPLKASKAWVHWGDPEKSAAALARLGVRAVSLANNHAMDALGPGLRSTRAALAGHGIGAFGAGADSAKAALPLRADLRIGQSLLSLIVMGAYEETSADAKNGCYATGSTPGVSPLDGDTLAARIRALKRTDPKLFIVVFPHWGRNYAWRSEEQLRVGHLLIDAGANLVLGHGAHLFQEVEPYRGRLIVYSLGNFVFLSPGRYKQRGVHTQSLAARLEFDRRDGRLGASLALYLVASDNRATKYRPSILHGKAFERAWQKLLDAGSLSRDARDELGQKARRERDEIGDCIRVDLGGV